VSRHKGTIEVQSEVGRGTTFRVILPKALSGELAAAQALPTPDAELPPGQGERVLVVEDEDGAREGLRDILESLGYVVVAAPSGEEAVALPLEPSFDVLLTDLMLPGINGTQLAIGLKARWPSLKVILTSGYAEDDVVRKGVGEGTIRFLQKPFGIAHLAREIRAALAQDTEE
jgi:CheY-like chemotaxis protein